MGFMVRYFLLSSLLLGQIWGIEEASETLSALPAMGEAGMRAVSEAQPAFPQLRVHNRILCSVLGKPISVLDVQKALEIQFFVSFPEHRDHPQAKFEFMMVRWKDVLSDLINRELVLADAEDRDLKVVDGDVREEMIRRFGADLVPALDSLSMGVDEAWDMIRDEIRAQRMIGAMVLFPAISSVTADEIRSTYVAMCDQTAQQDEFSYRILTVKGEDPQQASVVAQQAYELLHEGQRSPEEVVACLRGAESCPQGVVCQISEEFCQPKRMLAEQNRSILEKLQVGAFSAPMAQHSRASRQDVHRIFILTGRKTSDLPSLDQAAQKIQESLGDQRAQALHRKYMMELRERYGITDEYLKHQIPADFQPFEMTR